MNSKKLGTRIFLLALAATPVFLIALDIDSIGYMLLGFVGLMTLALPSKQARIGLAIILGCLLILNFVDINTSTLTRNFLTMGIPLLVISFGILRWSRFLLEQPLSFKLLSDKPLTAGTIIYPLFAFCLAALVIPWYFGINPDVPFHWSLGANPTDDQLTRLFWGSNFLGMWDEVFFINVVFALLRRQFSFWQANLVQASFFTSFLYELAFTGIGPLLIFPFALLQGYIYEQRESVGYIIIIHLLVDSALYLSIVSAHSPGRYSWFPLI